MAFEIPILVNGTHAAGSASLVQFTGCSLNSTGQVVVASGAGVAINGVLQNDPAAIGDPASLMQVGVTKMVAGAALATPGVAISVDNQGRAIAQTGSNATVGFLEDTASGAGVLCSVRLI